MKLPTARFAMLPPIQNALANRSDCKSQSSKRNSVLWTNGLLRYGAPYIVNAKRIAADRVIEIG